MLLLSQSKRDILSETKYIELVLVADHKEVREERSLLPSTGACTASHCCVCIYVYIWLYSFLQYVTYQKNNKTIIYRMLDVANQVDWVSFIPDLKAYTTLTHLPIRVFSHFRNVKAYENCEITQGL